MEDDNLTTPGSDEEQPGTEAVNETPVDESGPQEGQPQDQSFYDQVRGSDNFANVGDEQVNEEMAKSFLHGRQSLTQAQQENADLKRRLDGYDKRFEAEDAAQVNEGLAEQYENDPFGTMQTMIENAVGKAAAPIAQSHQRTQLQDAETELRTVFGDNFDALKASPVYEEIKQASGGNAETFKYLINTVASAAQSFGGNPQAIHQTGVRQGQQTEQAKTAAHLLPNSSGGVPNNVNQEPQDEQKAVADEILSTARRLAGKKVLGV